ncbi:hypothetical protein [Marinobacterium sp. BA1]|uniref:hypothetical protein n=1 Tax=Marinobacterium sp. BA1 TaxID=3138931 RepID=UPI0032E7BCE3
MDQEHAQVAVISLHNEGLRCVLSVNGQTVADCPMECADLVQQIGETAAGLSIVLGVPLEVSQQANVDQEVDLFDGDPIAACAHQERLAM